VKVLIFSASIGEGHDLPARVLAEGIEREAPAAEIEIVDSLVLVHPLVRRLVLDSSRFHSKWGNRIFDLSYKLITDVAPTRWFAAKLTQWLAARPIRRAVLQRDPDVAISTYPGTTEVLGDLRAKGKIDIPVVSAITDLAALQYWAHPGVDLHLITHPESAEEVRQIAPGTDVRCVRGLTDERFYQPRAQADARSELDLPADGSVVIVSGGGWAVGDLAGAVRVARTLPATVLVLCARNERARERLSHTFEDDPAVRVLGFVDDMPTLLAATDALVHSTAGLTVLEAIMVGSRPISYGWGIAHIRGNNRAFARFGIAEVATTADELRASLRRAVAAPRVPRHEEFAALPAAADVVLGLARS
jgi:processive 1,2-diacylglycerol beta-glucosyltransferase